MKTTIAILAAVGSVGMFANVPDGGMLFAAAGLGAVATAAGFKLRDWWAGRGRLSKAQYAACWEVLFLAETANDDYHNDEPEMARKCKTGMKLLGKIVDGLKPSR